MKISIEQVPHMVAHCRQVAKGAKERYGQVLERAAASSDPEVRHKHQEDARTELDIALSDEADADELTEKFKAAGGQLHKLQ